MKTLRAKTISRRRTQSGRRGRRMINWRAGAPTSRPCAKSQMLQGLCKDFFLRADIEEKCMLQLARSFFNYKEFLPPGYPTEGGESKTRIPRTITTVDI